MGPKSPGPKIPAPRLLESTIPSPFETCILVDLSTRVLRSFFVFYSLLFLPRIATMNYLVITFSKAESSPMCLHIDMVHTKYFNR